MPVNLPDDLVLESGGRIVFAVLDGLGGLPHERSGLTELEAAKTPNLDEVAKRAALGLHIPVTWGIAPGSGPGHLALFGYDPIRYNIGRGVLSALGVGFALEPGDVAIRLNFATVDANGDVTDRRAGRPTDEENRRLIEALRSGVSAPAGVQVFFESEKEHRAVLILRGNGLSAEVSDTDPQVVGVPPLRAEAGSAAAARTAGALNAILDSARAVLAGEERANALLARGIDAFHRYPTFADRYKLKALAIARYPMYSGVARLVGMEPYPLQKTDEDSVRVLAAKYSEFDFHFIHFKAMDSRGEDGDFDAKVAAIEAVDALVPEITALDPDVFIVTGDHSTPALWRAHSWHPVPILLASKWCRWSADATFGERACRSGELGTFPASSILTLALAHAGRLAKFGA
jgi:2,3-bisphosphoglycerate-independent phosphoglycerate mutase